MTRGKGLITTPTGQNRAIRGGRAYGARIRGRLGHLRGSTTADARSLRPTRTLCPFTPKAGVNWDPTPRARLTVVGMTRGKDDAKGRAQYHPNRPTPGRSGWARLRRLPRVSGSRREHVYRALRRPVVSAPDQTLSRQGSCIP